jgi:hypothetical protein
MQKTIIALALTSLLSLLPLAAHSAPQPSDSATMGIRTSLQEGPKLVAPPENLKPIDEVTVDAHTMTCARIAGKVSNKVWFNYGCDKVVDLD